MKISEVIKKLQEIQKEHGDLVVWVQYDDITESDFELFDNNILEIL